jgi:hypothetical protein
MGASSPILRRVESFCGRLNDRLLVFAMVLLAVVVVVTVCERRLPEILSLFQPVDSETGKSILEQ